MTSTSTSADALPLLLPFDEWKDRIWLNGKWVLGSAGAMQIMEPSSGASLASVGSSGLQDIDAAAKFALQTQKKWASALAGDRAAVLRRVAGLLDENRDWIEMTIRRESGSIRAKATFEIEDSFPQLHEAASLSTHPIGSILPANEPGQHSIAKRLPIGVVGVITPWNFPFLLAIRVIAPAIALGNSVILKPDPQTPLSGGVIWAWLFEQAGLPPGVLQVLPGGAEIGQALVKHPDVGMISFTGSTTVGREIGQVAGNLLKRVSLELGGNNALVVLDDADPESAASAASFGSFFHQGQICMTAGRLIVHSKIAESFTKSLVRRAKNMKIGDPSLENIDIGPMINGRQRDNVASLIADAKQKGARLCAGGNYNNLFYEPTVLSAVTPDMKVFAEEIFGPVAPITVFNSDEEAEHLANLSGHGLSASVRSGDLQRGLRFAEKLKAGMVHVNDQTVVHSAHVPFGGVGASGNGSRFGSLTNLEEFTYLQWVTYRSEQKRYDA